MKLKKLKTRIILLIFALFIITVFIYIENNTIDITYFNIVSSKISKPIRIVHLSDLHNKQFGRNNAKLIRKVQLLNPDIIFFTGDLIDRNTQDISNSVNTLKELNHLSQIYYIPGNHEHWSGKYELLSKKLTEVNINVLNCEIGNTKVNSEDISILGLDEAVNSNQLIRQKLVELSELKNYKIVLSHYPENFPNGYNSYNIDIVLSGHAHGGQFNIPFLGGLYAPGQGFFPKYHKGLYVENGVNLIVSRGLGNSVIPVRVFNRPEIVVIDLK